MPKTWSYGVTTCKERIGGHVLWSTLRSLCKGGFDRPRLFADGCLTSEVPSNECLLTSRFPTIGAFGSWWLTLVELYLREPNKDCYAIFQDDIICVKNLRSYLDHCAFPDRGYWNLYTHPSNQAVAPLRSAGDVQGSTMPPRWFEGFEFTEGHVYHGRKQQAGRGAIALVFSRQGITTLLSSGWFVSKPQDASSRRTRCIDGAVVESMNRAGWREYVHDPSLVQHIDSPSTVGNKPHKKALSFPGEEFDAMGLV